MKRWSLVAVAFIALISVVPATAHWQSGVAGTWAFSEPPEERCLAVGPLVYKCEGRGITAYEGDLTGESITTWTSTVNCKTGRYHGHGPEEFEGVVDGVGAGTLTWLNSFGGEIDCATGEIEDFSGRGDWVKGVGGLSGIRGSLRFSADAYRGTLRTS